MPVYSLYRTQNEGKYFSTGGLFQETLLQELLHSHYFVQRIQNLKSFIVSFFPREKQNHKHSSNLDKDSIILSSSAVFISATFCRIWRFTVKTFSNIHISVVISSSWILNKQRKFAILLMFTTATVTKHLYKKKAPPCMGQEAKKKIRQSFSIWSLQCKKPHELHDYSYLRSMSPSTQ